MSVPELSQKVADAAAALAAATPSAAGAGGAAAAQRLQLRLAEACEALRDALRPALDAAAASAAAAGGSGSGAAAPLALDPRGGALALPDAAVAELLRKNFSRRPEDRLGAADLAVSGGAGAARGA